MDKVTAEEIATPADGRLTLTPSDDFVVDLAARPPRVSQAELVEPVDPKLLAELRAKPINHSIYEKRLGKSKPFMAVPCSLFFYYIRVNRDGALCITHHFYPCGDPCNTKNPANPKDWPPIPRKKKELTRILKEMALDARRGGKKYKKLGENFEGIKWLRKSYIAFFIDEVDWKLTDIGKDAAIKFVTQKKPAKKLCSNNHSFFDGMKLPITMPIRRPKPHGPTHDRRSAIVFINHAKSDEKGTDLKATDRQYYQFQIAFKVRYAGRRSAGMIVIFDPDGNNLGPPIAPP